MFWQPYQPDDKAPWNLRRAAHLHRRAGFAATWEELQQDLHDGPRAAVDRLLEGKALASAAPEDFEATSRLLAEAAVASGNIHRLKAWWLYRMIFSPDPLGERFALDFQKAEAYFRANLADEQRQLKSGQQLELDDLKVKQLR